MWLVAILISEFAATPNTRSNNDHQGAGPHYGLVLLHLSELVCAAWFLSPPITKWYCPMQDATMRLALRRG